MAVADNAYSRFVQFAKVALPLLALALLSTMFLFSRTIDPEDAIPFAEVDVEQIAREQRLKDPNFSSVTADGTMIMVVADAAKPDANNPRRMDITEVTADIETPTGTQIKMQSQEARYDGERNTMDLIGNVRLSTSTGLKLNSDMLVANLSENSLFSPGPVDGAGPNGTLEAGQMELKTVGRSQLLVLKNGVKLIYHPNK